VINSYFSRFIYRDGSSRIGRGVSVLGVVAMDRLRLRGLIIPLGVRTLTLRISTNPITGQLEHPA